MNRVEYKNIMIVEDDEELRNALFAHFSKRNDVRACATYREAAHAVENDRFDVALIDVILPDGDGLDLLRLMGDTPAIILSDLGSDGNLIQGFSAGAADYIVKPASLELIEMRMALRLLPSNVAQLSSHGLVLDMCKRTALYKRTPLALTSSEFNILMFLMRNAGTFYTASEIYENVWKMPYLNTTTIKAHLSNLRKKMYVADKACAELIITEFGKGYSFVGANAK